jgi:threonine synthase
VSDEAIVQMQQRLCASEGLLICPEGAATLAAAQKLREQGWLASEETVVAVNTGTGLKYADVPHPQPSLLRRDADLPIA